MRRLLVEHVELKDEFGAEVRACLRDLETQSVYCVDLVEMLELNTSPRLYGHEGEIIDSEFYIQWADLCKPFETSKGMEYVQKWESPYIEARGKVLERAAENVLICEIKGLADRIIVDDLTGNANVGETIYLNGSLSIDYYENNTVKNWMIPYDPELG
ncbi:hypothetical protein [Feifania hominis]|uniref:Uncharacterized protein n=1 Tax=Feifania hominis TaxID=2763660 RepID=A0A926DFK1_9FIRM|nr:hypothetical protein [Feifania hominis]MBC8537238.1 hypothetical protein [Feifania hominis]